MSECEDSEEDEGARKLYKIIFWIHVLVSFILLLLWFVAYIIKVLDTFAENTDFQMTAKFNWCLSS